MNRRLVLCVLAGLLAISPIVSAGTYGGFSVDPSDQAMMTLLGMVISDLGMCSASMRASYAENLLAIGHLNNAQSALRRTDLNPAYAPLIREILDRIGKIKFYMVMNDLPNVQMRLNQLMAVLRTLTGQQTGTYIPSTGYGQSGSTNSFPQGRPTEIPVGGGQNVTPSGAPSMGIPVN